VDAAGILAAGLAGAGLAALWSVSLVGWTRTRPLRRGALPAAGDRAGPAATSHATFLPGATGLFLMVAGVVGLAGGWGLGAVVLTAAGLAVAIAGFAARVDRLELRPEAFVIHYRARPSFVLPWDECRSLSSPRWPLGGWRVGGDPARILMPSDLLGHEDVLGTIIARAGLLYRGGVWIRSNGDPGDESTPPR
jgi:hypothetical protein